MIMDVEYIEKGLDVKPVQTFDGHKYVNLAGEDVTDLVETAEQALKDMLKAEGFETKPEDRYTFISTYKGFFVIPNAPAIKFKDILLCPFFPKLEELTAYIKSNTPQELTKIVSKAIWEGLPKDGIRVGESFWVISRELMIARLKTEEDLTVFKRGEYSVRPAANGVVFMPDDGDLTKALIATSLAEFDTIERKLTGKELN
jgi:hypothetical protein